MSFIISNGSFVRTPKGFVTVPSPPAPKFPVGGKIFYIDDTSTGAIYHFYDENENEMTDVRVGDAPAYYSVEGTPNKNKYYVFYSSIISSKSWTYYKGGAYVYNVLGTSDGIGTGISNTDIVMNADDGAYITADSGGVATIWYEIKNMRDNSYGGVNDWFVPSKAELEALHLATDRNGKSLTMFFNTWHIWSSSEYSASNPARNGCTWDCNS